MRTTRWNPPVAAFPSNRHRTSAEADAAHRAGLLELERAAEAEVAVDVAFDLLRTALSDLRPPELFRLLVNAAAKKRAQVSR